MYSILDWNSLSKPTSNLKCYCLSPLSEGRQIGATLPAQYTLFV